VVLPKFLWKLGGCDFDSPAVKQYRDIVCNELDSIFDERIEQMAKGEIHQERWDMDVLQRLMVSYEAGELSKDDIRAEILGFFLAGHETTANTLSFLLWEIMKNPEIYQKIEDEVKDVVIEGGKEIESISHLK
jgi:cytochrome P450